VAEALTDAELIAILIREGFKGNGGSVGYRAAGPERLFRKPNNFYCLEELTAVLSALSKGSGH
jgi:hypothetical protein